MRSIKWLSLLLAVVALAMFIKGRNTSDPEIETKEKARVSQTKRSEPAKPMPVPSYLLDDAARQELVSWKAGGAGLTDVELQISSRAEKKIRVEIPQGVIFFSVNESVQNMVVRTAESTVLYPGKTKILRISAACINMRRQTPQANHAFQSGLKMADGDLEKLLKSSDFAGKEFRIQQYAIWTVTDNPKRSEYPGIGFSGSGGGPSQGELMQVRRLLESAGVHTEHYRAFEDRKTSPSGNRRGAGSPDSEPVQGNNRLHTWIDENGVRHFSDRPPKQENRSAQ